MGVSEEVSHLRKSVGGIWFADGDVLDGLEGRDGGAVSVRAGLRVRIALPELIVSTCLWL